MRVGLLDTIYNEFRETDVDLDRMSQKDLQTVKDICDQKEYIIWLNNHSTVKPMWVNDFAKRYYGFPSKDLSGEGFDFYGKFLHPDHFNDVHQTITFFVQNPGGILNMPYKVKNNTGEWCWTYSQAKTLNFAKNGKAQIVISIVYDIEDLLNSHNSGSKGEFIRENAARYNSLTNREREVLKLIATEMTSNDIADTLHIETSTVDTHRKHLIRKLNVKSSIGLVKYAILFSGS